MDKNLNFNLLRTHVETLEKFVAQRNSAIKTLQCEIKDKKTMILGHKSSIRQLQRKLKKIESEKNLLEIEHGNEQTGECELRRVST